MDFLDRTHQIPYLCVFEYWHMIIARLTFITGMLDSACCNNKKS